MNIQGRDSDIKCNVCPSDRQLALRAKYEYLYDNINYYIISLTCVVRFCVCILCISFNLVKKNANRRLDFIIKFTVCSLFVIRHSKWLLTRSIHNQTTTQVLNACANNKVYLLCDTRIIIIHLALWCMVNGYGFP